MSVSSWAVWSVPIEGEPVRVGRFDAEPRDVPAKLGDFSRAGARDALVIQRDDAGPPVTRQVYGGTGTSWRGNQNPRRRKRKRLAE